MPDPAPPAPRGRSLRVRPGEWPLLVGAAAMHFCLLAAYYVMRPLRDEVGAHRSDELDELWLAGFFTLLAVSPIYAAVATRGTRGKLLSRVYLFFVGCVLAFTWALGGLRLGDVGLPGLGGEARVWAERALYVWVSVFVMFVVSVFWSFVSDVAGTERGRRLFGPIAAAGTIGGIGGAFATGRLSEAGVSAGHLMLLAGVLLLCARAAMGRLDALAERSGWGGSATERIGGSVRSGFLAVVRSPLLLAICGFLLLMTLSSTVYYFAQSHLTRELFTDRGERRAYLADVDLWTNVAALVGQAGLFAWVVARIGTGWTLALLPIVSLLGMLFLAWAAGGDAAPEAVLPVLLVVLVATRASRYAFARPARELLFTLVSREERFKSKNFIDTVVYRGGDTAFGQAYNGLITAGFGVAGVALLAAPLGVVWIFAALGLGVLAKRRGVGD